MEKINFVNGLPPYISAENLEQMQDNVENAINEKAEGTIIYNNSTGSKANITFNTEIDLTKIKRLKIYHMNDVNNGVAIKEIPIELGSTFVLSEMVKKTDTLSYNFTTTYTVSSTGLTIGRYVDFQRNYKDGSITGDTSETSQHFLICKVVAFEY